MAITTRLAIADGHICIYMIISCLAILPFAQLLFHRGPGCQVLPDAKDSLWLRARARARSYCLWARLGYQSLAYPPVLSSSIILPNNLFSLPSPELRSLKRCLTISCHTKWMRHGILLNHPLSSHSQKCNRSVPAHRAHRNNSRIHSSDASRYAG